MNQIQIDILIFELGTLFGVSIMVLIRIIHQLYSKSQIKHKGRKAKD